jgi:acetyl esterase/lipase
MPIYFPDGILIHRDLAYESPGHARQILDLYVPRADRPVPVVVWIHGGEFRKGSRRDGFPTWPLGEGMAVASIDYRLSGDAIFPAQIQDVKAAVRWLRAHAAEYGLDGARVAAWGASAGGHLAAMVGVSAGTTAFDIGANLGCSSGVKAVVDFYGPSDFLQMDAHRGEDDMVHETPDSPESLVIGGAIQDHPDLVKQANPIAYVTSSAPPFLIVHGDADPFVPHHQSVLLADALRAAGVPVTFHTVRGGGHGRFRDPGITALVREFLTASFA